MSCVDPYKDCVAERSARIAEWEREYKQNNRAHFTAKEGKRRAAKASATPAWLTPAQEAQIENWYILARMTGWQVDHIEPLLGDDVCGLHVPWNLRLLPKQQNQAKGKKIDRCARRDHMLRLTA